MTTNGMLGSWTWPAATSPVRGAVLAALPKDGSVITRKELIDKVHAGCPDWTVSTTAVHIHDLARSGSSGIVRVGYGLYRRVTP